MNQVEMHDSLTKFNSVTRDFFLDFGDSQQYSVTTAASIILEQKFSISDVAYKHNRKVYFNLWMWLGLMGGIAMFLYAVFNSIVSPFARFGFQMRAYKRLYWARTSDEKLFKTRPEDSVRYRRDFEECQLSQNPFFDEYVPKVIQEIKKEMDEQFEGGGRR